MKVVIEFLETGHYKDNAWEGDMYIEKGEASSRDSCLRSSVSR